MNRNESKRLFASDITGTITANRQQVDVEWRAGTLPIDERKFNGGQDLGPDPFTMIVADLVGCTLITLRMYILRTIVLGQSVGDEQGERLLDVAKNRPAAKLLEGEIVIDTVLDGDVP
jgi:putative redox protein